jgi:hypothetical protein
MVQRIHRDYIKATKGICIDVITTTGSVSGRYLAQIKSECLLAEWHIILYTNLTKRVVISENKNPFDGI